MMKCAEVPKTNSDPDPDLHSYLSDPSESEPGSIMKYANLGRCIRGIPSKAKCIQEIEKSTRSKFAKNNL